MKGNRFGVSRNKDGSFSIPIPDDLAKKLGLLPEKKRKGNTNDAQAPAPRRPDAPGQRDLFDDEPNAEGGE